jgi:SAM-dependent methyltransferase
VSAAAGRYQGVLRILRYNRRFFALATVAALLAGGAALSRKLPPAAAVAAGALALVTLASMGTSLAVSHYVYDRSTLARWDWLAPLLERPPRRWANIHAGLDDASPILRRLFPGAAGQVLDIYDPSEMTEPSIAEARRAETPPEPAMRAKPSALPLADGGADLVLLYFAAHELRRKDARGTFFNELARVVAPEGCVLLVEHLRDVANAAAFGPGALHFLPRKEWLRLAALSNLTVRREQKLTPFVSAFFLEKRA